MTGRRGHQRINSGWTGNPLAAKAASTRSQRRRLAACLVCLASLLLVLPASLRSAIGTADEVHYTFTGPTSVAFDWRGTATDIQYGQTATYGSTATTHPPTPVPSSSAGPFQEVELTGLTAGATYHYSIGGGTDHTFTTAPTGAFRFDVIADVGSSRDYSNVPPTQNQVAADSPAFVLAPGDLTYGEPFGSASVDQHFNDVMAWSQQAAYMPAWGNHEWENASFDDFRNYKGRFVLPNPQTSPTAPAPGCCGEDWSWFDAGGVRFISYPEPYTSATWSAWQTQANPIFAAAQADPSINFIVTFGHRPAYSTGFHPGETTLAGILNTFGDQYSKYVLNLNGHSHDYERFQPIHGVTHITAGGGGATLEPPWATTDSRTVFRAMHLEHLRVDVSSTGMRIEAVCGPPTINDDIACVQGSVIDSYTIGANPPPPPPPAPTLYVDRGNSNCSDGGSGTAAQPFCSIGTAASRVTAGQTVLVFSGTYSESVTVTSSGTASAPINFVAAPGATVTVTGSGSGSANGVYLNNRSYVTVQGFNVTGTSADGIVVKNSSNITIRGNHVSYSGQPAQGKLAKGIRLDGATDSVVSNNTVDHNTDYGIYLLSGSTRNQIVGNRVFLNARVIERAAAGIRLYASPGNTVSGNVSHDNEDSGIESFTGSNNNLIVNNVTYNNGDHGIDNYASTGQRLIANTVYKNLTAGINVEGSSTGATIANNVSVDNGIASPRTHSNIRVDSASTSGTTMDYDVVYLSTPDVMLIWNSVNYTSLTAFKSATGQETHGTQASPRFQNAAGGDFHLTAGSPAIDSANSGASGQPSVDAEGNPRLDDPATSNTGVGPRAFDDRGVYEFDGAGLDHIVISPASATIAAGGSQTYTAQGFDTAGNSFDVTGSTNFSISPDGSCTANICTASAAGPHTVTGNDTGAISTASLNVTALALDHLVLSPASATITPGQLARRRHRDYDLHDQPQWILYRCDLYGFAGRGAYGDGDEGRQDGHCFPAGFGRQPRPHRDQPGERDDRGGRLADVHGAGFRRLRQLRRRRDRIHHVFDRPERDLHGCELHGHGGGGAHGDRQRLRQDEHRLADGDGRDARPSGPVAGLGDDRGGRVAGVYGAGTRPVRQLAGRRHRVDHVLDRSEWILYRCHLYGVGGRGAHGDRQQRRQDWYCLAERDDRRARSPCSLTGLGDDHGRRLADLYGGRARPVRQLLVGCPLDHDLLDLSRRLLYGGELYRLGVGGAHCDGGQE